MHTRQNLAVSLVLAISMTGISYGAGGILPGDGLSESTAYLIEDLADFDVFANQANAATYWASGVYTKLTCDPNLTGSPYTTAVIAPDTSTSSDFQGTPFAGIFDGNGHTIRNLTIDTAGTRKCYLGLFGQIEGSGAEIKNIGIENINIIGGYDSGYLGGLCGFNDDGTITNCYAAGPISGETDDGYLGGLCGCNSGTIANCYAAGSVTGGHFSWYLGGLCGSNSGTITDCYATGLVTGGADSYSLGGLCGVNSRGTITNCYATGSVTGGDGSRYLGGLCGCNSGYFSSGTITNCYATSSVNGGDDSDYLGGLCGYNNRGTITNCYATGSVTGRDDSCSLGGLCGENDSGTITDCYAIGSVTGGDNSYDLGGLCGENYGTITNCYATGSVTGGHHLGGLCGRSDEGAITNCYFYLFSGPDNGWGTALDDLQMQDAVSFAGFDFAGNSNDGEDDYWTIVSGYCPKLTWQTDNGPLVPSPPVTTLSGSGYSYDPFQVNSYADFTEFRTNSSLRCGYYILTVDIDLYGDTFTTAVINRYFGGHFDGNGHVIGNITIDTAGADNDYLGLFSRISVSVSDLGIENINITGGYDSDYLGSLCGYNYSGTINNCYATGSVNGGYDSRYLGGLCGFNECGTITNCYATGSVTGGICSEYLGGLCGRNYYGTITNCYATGSVTGGYDLGGLCGKNDCGTITNCYTTGSVTGRSYSRFLGGLCGKNDCGTITNCYAAGSVTGGNYLGGLCGRNSGTITNCYAAGSVTGDDSLGGLCGLNECGTITNCYATGSVTGYKWLGGLCGENWYSPITNCYAAGSVTGDDYLGGLCGLNSSGTTTNCFWDTQTSGTTDGVGNQDPDPAGVIGKTTVEMQMESTFTDANWDFDVVPLWHMPFQVVGYPMLGWQKDIPGDFTGRYGVYMDDFAVLSDAWLSDNAPTANWNEHCDLNGNGVIDIADLKIFVEYWLCK